MISCAFFRGSLWALLLGLGGLACASRSPTTRSSFAVGVHDAQAGFPVTPPLTRADASHIAEVTQALLVDEEHITFVEAMPCTPESCGNGIDLRAEAVITRGDSEEGEADAIALCRRAGRWFAVRAGQELNGDPMDGSDADPCPAPKAQHN